MNALAQLEAIGYDVSLEGGKIRLHYRWETDPDPAIVVPLLERVKSHKAEAISLLRRKQEADGRFKAALHEIQQAYIPGLLRHIEKDHPDLCEQIREAEDALEIAWAEVLGGKTTLLDAFEGALERWNSLHLQAIHEHRRQSCSECPTHKRKACSRFWEERIKEVTKKNPK